MSFPGNSGLIKLS